MRLIRSRPLSALVVSGAVLVIAGGAWFVGSGFGAVSFGWFTYSATTEVNFSDDIVALSRSGSAALVVLVLGALLLSAAGGYHLGQRRAQPSTSTTGPENG
ncbi:hypothetical protein [Sanguibacter sp. 25GB23B1]|uniref:hypothetical protein n=1 Tax=unclassified Sanguibacter TaxID=2645534 RepID=UPI0032AFA15A